MVEERQVTTSAELPGHRVSRNLGTAFGHAACAMSSWGNLGAVVQSLVSGDLDDMARRIGHAHQQAHARLLERAGEMGANAVLGVRYDTHEIAQCVTVVLAYGTAALVEPASR